MTARQMIELYLKNTLDEKNVDTILKLDYKGGRGHFKINLNRIDKVSDFRKVMEILAESDYKEFDACADIVREYLTFVFDTVVSLKKEHEAHLTNKEDKAITMYCDTLIKRYKSFADAFNKICSFDPVKKITLENAPEIPTAKKDNYYIMQFDKLAHKWTLQNIFGFSFVFNGFKVGVHKTADGKAWDAALLGYGCTFGMYEKSKKAAILTAIDVLKKCNFSPCEMSDTAARFMACAAENDIDISEQLTPTETAKPEPETVESVGSLPEPETVVTPVEPPTEPETVVTPVEPPTEPETVVTPVEPPTEPETAAETATEPEPPRPVCSFTPLAPGERHAAAITTGTAAPPMVVIWLYIAILQKHLFEVSHTLERCHVPVYGFTRLLYTVVALLLYRVDYSGLFYGLPLFVVPNFELEHGNTLPCTLYGFTALRVLPYVETVGGLTRLTGFRTCYHDTS